MIKSINVLLKVSCDEAEVTMNCDFTIEMFTLCVLGLTVKWLYSTDLTRLIICLQNAFGQLGANVFW